MPEPLDTYIAEVTDARVDVADLEWFMGMPAGTSSKSTRTGSPDIYPLREYISKIGFSAPVSYGDAVGSLVDDLLYSVEYNGRLYTANPSEIPFTPAATFDESQWILQISNTVYDDVESLLSSVDAFPVGSVILAGAEKIAYRAVALGGHVVTTGGAHLDVIPDKDGLHDIRAWGVKAGSVDYTAEITAAYGHANKLFFPEGEYILSPEWRASTRIGTNKNVKVLFECTSDTHIRLARDAVLKIADGVSTDQAPADIAICYWEADASNITIEGGTFDFNKSSNPLSPNRGANDYSRSKHIVAWAWRCAGGGHLFRDSIAKNANGSNMYVIGQPLSAADTFVGYDVEFNNIYCENCGYDAEDHTSLLSYYDNSRIINCRFKNDTIAPAATNAFELHGSDSYATAVEVDGYHRGFFIGAHLSREISNIRVYDCKFNVRTQGGQVWVGPNQLSASKMYVRDNVFNIAKEAYVLAGAISSYSAVSIKSISGVAGQVVKSCSVIDNDINFQGSTTETPCYAVTVGTDSASGYIELVKVTGNTANNVTKFFDGNIKLQGGSIRRLIVSDNPWITVIGEGTAESSVAIDINPERTLPPFSVAINNNMINALSGDVIGIRIASAIDHLNAGGNEVFESPAVTSLQKIQFLTSDQVIKTGSDAKTVTASTAELEDVNSLVNIHDKYIGKMLFNTTTKQPVWTGGSTPGSAWKNADGVNQHSPI